MAGLFGWIFGRGRKTREKGRSPASSARPEPPAPPLDLTPPPDLSLPGQAYYGHLERLTEAISSKDYQEAAAATRASLPLLRAWLEDPRADGQRIEIRIPALGQGGTMLAIRGDMEGLVEMRRLVSDFGYLEGSRQEVEEHFTDMELFGRIREVIRAKPGVLQNRMKAELGIEDGRRASRLIAYLEKAGEIRREKSGKTYELQACGE